MVTIPRGPGFISNLQGEEIDFTMISKNFLCISIWNKYYLINVYKIESIEAISDVHDDEYNGLYHIEITCESGKVHKIQGKKYPWGDEESCMEAVFGLLDIMKDAKTYQFKPRGLIKINNSSKPQEHRSILNNIKPYGGMGDCF